jgi:KDO2-lipid IV(A) lauroyltransferase
MGNNSFNPTHKTNYQTSIVKSYFNKLVVYFLVVVSYLPFWLIYIISDSFYLVLRFIIRYRKQIITENLKFSFPEMGEKKIKKIRNRYYRNMCDIAVESVKLYNMSEVQLNKRLIIKGAEVVEQYYKIDKSIIVFAFHYNNWEWCSFLQARINHLVLMVHNPIRGNEEMDRFLEHSRGQWGGESVPVNQTAKTTMKYIKEGILTALWLAADQTAPARSKFWTMFLNREAPFFAGPEKIAVKTNQPIFFQHVKRLKRGYYEVDYSLLVEEPAKMKPEDILLKYVNKMEEIIKKEPEYYLWSHRRWKHTRPEDIPLIERKIKFPNWS